MNRNDDNDRPDELQAARDALRAANRRLEEDIARRERVEQRLRENEESLRALINATDDDVVVLLNLEQEVVIANERAAKTLRRPLTELLGKRITDLIPGQIADQRMAYALQVLENGRALRFEDQRDGRWYDNNFSAVLDRNGLTRGVAIFARDITERKTMEQALSQAKVEAERANLAKSRFLAAANHDLRQPLHALGLLLDTLAFSPLEESARQTVGDMKETLRIMETLLNALLDVSKLDAGTVIPRIQDFHAVPFLTRMCAQFKAIADEKRVRIRLFPRNAALRTDPALLARILQNFISNAIRHTRGTRILVGCRKAAPGLLRIEVWDQGDGIPATQTERIFEDFYQLGNPARNRQQGLGLGLAIAKRVADLLGLGLRVRSRPGKGSVFSVDVPEGGDALQQAGAPGREPIATPAMSQSVLIVDDDEDVLNATARLLGAWGYHPVCAADAERAIGLLRDPALRPIVALVDYRLPGGATGVDFLQALPEHIGRAIPGILITGDTAPEVLSEAQASGFPVLHKPVETGRLLELIRQRHR